MESGERAVPLPLNFFQKFYAKTVHFRAKFSLVLKCIQSIGKRGTGGSPAPLESATEQDLCDRGHSVTIQTTIVEIAKINVFAFLLLWKTYGIFTVSGWNSPGTHRNSAKLPMRFPGFKLIPRLHVGFDSTLVQRSSSHFHGVNGV